jgi:siroheme synthase (precorrin-2 oxidase/ferrochelatase)
MTRHLIDESLYNSLNGLFQDMISANMKLRPHINTVIDKYEKILASSGLLEKHKLYILSHKIHPKTNDIIILKKDIRGHIGKTQKKRSLTAKIMSKIMNRDPINNAGRKGMAIPELKPIKHIKPKRNTFRSSQKNIENK